MEMDRDSVTEAMVGLFAFLSQAEDVEGVERAWEHFRTLQHELDLEID
jgi:hypothetical protein